MATWTDLIRGWPGEEIVVRYDRDSEAWMFIAIHATHGTRSVGGCRMKVYPTPEDGLWDAMRLAEGMTHKWAAIDVNYGGGKAVIALSKPVAGEARTALLRRFGRMIDSLNGRYGTGPDIGTTPADMAVLATETISALAGSSILLQPNPSGPLDRVVLPIFLAPVFKIIAGQL